MYNSQCSSLPPWSLITKTFPQSRIFQTLRKSCPAPPSPPIITPSTIFNLTLSSRHCHFPFNHHIILISVQDTRPPWNPPVAVISSSIHTFSILFFNETHQAKYVPPPCYILGVLSFLSSPSLRENFFSLSVSYSFWREWYERSRIPFSRLLSPPSAIVYIDWASSITHISISPYIFSS